VRRVHGVGPVEQAVLRLLADGTPRTAREISEALNLARRSVHGALQRLQGEEYRRPALVAIHAGPTDFRPRMWTITGAGRLTVRREVTE
jgi:DNA-binding MarR family transcriptional regulator